MDSGPKKKLHSVPYTNDEPFETGQLRGKNASSETSLLGFEPGLATYHLCDLGQVTESLCALVSSSENDSNDFYPCDALNITGCVGA